MNMQYAYLPMCIGFHSNFSLIWFHGFTVSRFHGFTVSRFHGFTISRLVYFHLSIEERTFLEPSRNLKHLLSDYIIWPIELEILLNSYVLNLTS